MGVGSLLGSIVVLLNDDDLLSGLSTRENNGNLWGGMMATEEVWEGREWAKEGVEFEVEVGFRRRVRLKEDEEERVGEEE